MGCAGESGNATVPSVTYLGPTPGRPETLVVLLPGYGDTARDFDRHGLIDAMRRAGVDADVVAVAAHHGYHARRRLIDRLAQDVIGPARRRAYRHIWVAGISMGGMRALLAAQRFPEVEGVVVLSPYLGSHPTTMRIHGAGGLRRWTPPTIRGDPTTELWRWLKAARARGTPPVYLAYGAQEHWRGIAVLAEALPADHVVVAPGGHAWTTWRRAWPELLARGALQDPPT